MLILSRAFRVTSRFLLQTLLNLKDLIIPNNLKKKSGKNKDLTCLWKDEAAVMQYQRWSQMYLLLF